MPSIVDGLLESSDFSAVTKKMKPHAPPLPTVPQPAPRKVFRNAIPDGGAAPETKENVVQGTVDLQITLPNGDGTLVTMDGRKALMDVLVDLCGQYHLNPAEHTLELTSADGQPVSFKPNTVLGTLQANSARIKHRTPEERLPRKPAPKVPEQEEPAAPKHTRAKKTVRLVVNYHRGQKAVVRVNPLVPLQNLVPVICQKCEFNPARVLLLRDSVSRQELDLRKSLADLEIRELYVLDQTLVLQPKMVSAPALNFSAESLNSDARRASAGEKKGLLGLFNFNRRKSKTEESLDDMDQRNMHTNINGLSAVSGVCVEARPNTLGQSQSAMNLSRLSPKSEPKKRRAPAPPHPSAPTLMETQMQCSPALVAQTKPSSPNQLKKRKAPAPPPSVQATTSSSPTLAMTAALLPNTTTASDDSMSDLSHSIEDSEPAASICSSSSSDDAAESSSLAEEIMPEPAVKLATSLTSKVDPVPELTQKPPMRRFVKREPEETESALELKMEEVDNSRQSTIVWLHATEQEAETVSMCSSESLADQGYAASDGIADSPSTSPEDSVSLGPDPSLSPTQPQDDCDSDEGCATWGSRHSGNLRPGHQSVNRNHTEISAQIHLTLADLDTDLADEFNRSDEASLCLDDEIPVSVVDMDVPVTVIDDYPTRPSTYEAEVSRSSKLIIDHQNQNNNACMSKKANPFRADPIQSGDKTKQTEKVTMKFPGIKGKVEPDKQKLPEKSQNPAMTTVTQIAQNVPESRLSSASTVQSLRKEYTEVDRALSVKAQNMISQNTASRFGLKTFTIVPNKPVGPQNHIKSEGSLRVGAIKIDEFGNMVAPRETRDESSHLDEANDDQDSPLLDKAKAFWSSASKEDSVPTTYKTASVTTEDVETPKSVPLTVPSQTAEKASVTEPPIQVNGPSTNLACAVMKKLAVSDPAENIFFSEHRKNITFLKPSRRMSSQYVASAITKYTGNSSGKVDGVQESRESTAGEPYQAFKNEPKPVQAASNLNASTASETSVPFPAVKPYSSYPAVKQKVSKKAQITAADVTSIKTLNSGPRNSKPQQAAQVSSGSELTQTSAKEYMLIKMDSVNSTVNASRPAVAKKPEMHSLGLQPSPFGPVRKFKPVVPKLVEKETSLHNSLMEAIQSGNGMERLRKVSNSSTGTLKKPPYTEPEDERSSLLLAIQAENNSRLKKTSSLAATELEQFRKSDKNRADQRRTSSAIPAALTPSPSFTPPPPNFIPPPPPNFTPPPPPSFIPPPPPTLSSSKSTVMLPAGENPECAREAMLEAIRSGTGAERLRKVPVSTKTVKVNGRLGTIQASASRPQEH